MQKWGKRPIYFKNAEIMQNALIMQTLRPLHVYTKCEVSMSHHVARRLVHSNDSSTTMIDDVGGDDGQRIIV